MLNQESYNHLRNLQAIDAHDENFPLTLEERAEMIYLDVMFRIAQKAYDWTE